MEGWKCLDRLAVHVLGGGPTERTPLPRVEWPFLVSHQVSTCFYVSQFCAKTDPTQQRPHSTSYLALFYLDYTFASGEPSMRKGQRTRW